VVTDALQRRTVPRVGAFAATAGGAATVLVLLLALSLFLRTRAIDGSFWIDEGLSVGIASFPFAEIPGVLRQDGSPPLYYLALHVWMEVFGTSEAATHALSLTFALLSVPAALWAGWSLFGRRVGWIAAVFAALNPFLTIYAQETRMYSLMILLSILGTASFLHAFVFRRRVYVPVFALVLVVMLYTHNWALFFAAGALAALGMVARETGERRGLLRDAALAFGAAAVAYLPWVPTLLYQATHTGAPWSNPPSPFELIGGFSTVLAGQGSLVAVVLAGGVGLVRVLEGPLSAERTAILATITLAFSTLVAGWVFSQFTPAWANRYLGVLVGPVILAVAAGLPRAGRLGLVALALVVVFWSAYWATDEKSNVAKLERLFGDQVRAGDVVLSTQPEQVPVIAYYFGYDHEYASPMGPFPDPRVMDWRDALEKLRAAKPETTLEPIVSRMDVGERLVLVRPLIRSEGPWSAPWTELVRRRSEDWATALASDERFTRTKEYVPPYTERVLRALVVEVYEKTATG
jgi:hypothetical protein